MKFELKGMMTAEKAAEKTMKSREEIEEKKSKIIEYTTKNILNNILEEISNTAAQGKINLDFAVDTKHLSTNDRSILSEALKNIEQPLLELGYKVIAIGEYSNSWYRKTKKFGYVFIGW